MNQLALPLAFPPLPGADAFLVSGSNARAYAQLERWGSWPVMTAVLTGPRKSGRSLLARIFAARSGGAVIDTAEQQVEQTLFHAWNRAQETRRPLLLVADHAPVDWGIELPDLRSRLAASVVARIDPPDDMLMAALFERLFLQRGLDARADLIAWLAARIERSHVALLRAVDALDAIALQSRRRLSIALARDTLAGAGLIMDRSDPVPRGTT